MTASNNDPNKSRRRIVDGQSDESDDKLGSKAKWGRYMPRPTQPEAFVHPDDLESFKKNVGSRARSLVFQNIGEKEGYLILVYGSHKLRLMPTNFVPVPPLVFGFGDTVETVRGTKRTGTIYEIMWHSKNEAPMYFIRVGQKKISKRYYENDLRLVESA